MSPEVKAEILTAIRLSLDTLEQMKGCRKLLVQITPEDARVILADNWGEKTVKIISLTDT